MMVPVDFRQAVDASADAIMITDPEGIIGYVNPAFTNVTGLSPEDAIGETPKILNSSETPKKPFKTCFPPWVKGELGPGRYGTNSNRRRASRCRSTIKRLNRQMNFFAGSVSRFRQCVTMAENSWDTLKSNEM